MTRIAAGLALLILLPLAACSSTPRHYVHQYRSGVTGNMLAADSAGARLAQNNALTNESYRASNASAPDTDGR